MPPELREMDDYLLLLEAQFQLLTNDGVVKKQQDKRLEAMVWIELSIRRRRNCFAETFYEPNWDQEEQFRAQFQVSRAA